MHGTHHEHDGSREQQTGGEEVTGVGTVRDVPHQELGQTVSDGDPGERETEITTEKPCSIR